METRVKCFLFFILAIGNITDATQFRCDYVYSPKSGAWYKYHEIPAIWRDARLMCSLEGAILASPTNDEIKASMLKVVGGHSIFTGLHATISKGNFFSVDGIQLNSFYHKWESEEPNNIDDNESCIALNPKGEFSDVDCNKPRPYICYRNKIEPVNACGTPDPGYYLDHRTQKCYKFHTVPRQFNRAHFTCGAEGGHLAIINSDVEARVLRELFAKFPAWKMVGSFWKDVAFIGFTTWFEGLDYRTIHGQTLNEAGYAKFSGGEPNNATTGEYCGSIYRTALLNDLWCENTYAFICEKSPDFPAVCDHTTNTDTNKNRPGLKALTAYTAATMLHG